MISSTGHSYYIYFVLINKDSFNSYFNTPEFCILKFPETNAGRRHPLIGKDPRKISLRKIQWTQRTRCYTGAKSAVQREQLVRPFEPRRKKEARAERKEGRKKGSGVTQDARFYYARRPFLFGGFPLSFLLEARYEWKKKEEGQEGPKNGDYVAGTCLDQDICRWKGPTVTSPLYRLP